MRGAWWWACWLSFLRIYGFKAICTLAGRANVVANCANPQRLRPRTRDPDAQLSHTELESRTLHAQSGGGALGTGDAPLRLFDGLEDLVALCLAEPVAQRARWVDGFRDRVSLPSTLVRRWPRRRACRTWNWSRALEPAPRSTTSGEDVGQVLTDYDLVLNSQDARTLETSLRQQRQRDRADSPVSAVRNL